MSKIADSVKEFITPIVSELGYEIVEVEFAKKHNGDNLTVFIDKPDGVNLEDCETVHKAIDQPLDELDPTAGKPYTLNVSSPGADRPIVTDADYARNLNGKIEVKLFAPLEKKKLYVGKLLGFNESSIFLAENDESSAIEIDRKLISKATKYIEF